MHFSRVGLTFIMLLSSLTAQEQRSSFAGLAASDNELHEGVSKPFKSVVMSASLREVITKITVEEGDRITAGQLLVSLESEKEKLAVERLEQMLEKARFDASAAKRLFEQNVSSKDDMLVKDVELKRVTAELNIAKADLAERSVLAPIDGVLTNRLREVGEAVNEADPILQIIDTDRLFVLFHLETKYLSSLKLGQEAEVTFPEVTPAVVKKGKVHFIDPEVDARSGLFRVRILLDNKDGAARPGMKALWKVAP
jgi:membrane fusion protein (multidrug efflux system)